MPETWTAEKSEKLVLAIITSQKIDTKAASAKWQELYGDAPTNGALDQRFTKLRKAHGVSRTGGKKAPTTPSKPRTPKTPKAVKTPGSNKRKAVAMSEEDDTEPELNSKPERASSRSLRKKSATPKYSFGSDDEGDDEAENQTPRVNGHSEAKADEVGGSIKTESVAGDDSDVSEFGDAAMEF
ncbi:uncharacterized protein LTR77_008376 [Saxophila tyrrhenica]|uniref:Uncharacterized protein n=1 Tax=Saxophila tyrrhenica TaxID=1690608 RepID=A0AAV9P184_9PEZI|nr:hypothetical protein LTR77_008376 [Saxophila tyrrhenica]